MTNKPNPIHFVQRAICRVLVNTPLRSIAFDLLCKLKAEGVALSDIDLLRARVRLQEGSIDEAVEMLKEELRLHPYSKEAIQLFECLHSKVRRVSKPIDEEVAQAMELIRPYTMLSEERLLALVNGAKYVCSSGLTGNFVECGVSAGGSSVLLAWAAKRYSPTPRLVYCFDTFTGMPFPGSIDQHNGTPANKSGWGQGTCAAPLESLMSLAEKLAVASVIRPFKGLFQETLPTARQQIGPISLLHLDGDWYDSTMAILDNLYGQTEVGGYLQIDDYGYWDGCRKAVEDFEAKVGTNFFMNTIDSTGVWLTKSAP